MTGNITDIQRFCLNDGPGIRTSVFFKGCNMSCAWCHNPETVNIKKDLHFYEMNCINCLKCTEVCPANAHLSFNGLHDFIKSRCVMCGKCAEACYPEAMVVSGKEMTVGEVMFEVLQDIEYYKDSGGGVTLTGGEVTCQTGFAAEIAKSCKEHGISVAIETNLAFPYASMESLLRYIDLVMPDIKLYDDREHIKWTGVRNKPIFENLTKLNRLGISMIVRTPLIPGITDTEFNLKSIAGHIGKMENVKLYELLNYNPLGESKYRSLGIVNMFEKVRPLSDEKINELISMLNEFGKEIKVG